MKGNPSSLFIRRWRIEHNVTREDLADEAGLNARIITRAEFEPREMGVYKAIKLARAMGVSVEELFGRDAPMGASPPAWDGVARNAVSSLPGKGGMGR